MTMTREEWLVKFKHALEPWFEAHGGWAIPANTKVSCGWPCKGGTRAKNPVIGQCFHDESSEAKMNEIFISPTQSDSNEVGAILVHELVHAIVGRGEGHHGQFKVVAVKLGLEGKMTETHAGQALRLELERITNQLGPYPHARVNYVDPIKKQTTRMLAAECDICGYTLRVTRKWLAKGSPVCPTDPYQMDPVTNLPLTTPLGIPILKNMVFDPPEEEEEGEND